MEEIKFVDTKYFALYEQWRHNLDAFKGTPQDVIPEIFGVMESLVPVILSPAQIKYWDAFYYKFKTQKEIAEEFGLSAAPAVCKALKLAKAKMWSVLCVLFPKLAYHNWAEYFMPQGRNASEVYNERCVEARMDLLERR